MDQFALQCVRIRLARETEGEGLAFLFRHVERAEHPIPDGETASEILVEVNRIVGVVDLMMRRAQQDPAGDAGERDPQMCVLEVNVEMHEQHQDDVRI